MKRIILFFKGICMGLADVVPGVSGGTMALIMGIYTEFIDAIRGLHFRWVAPLWRWLTAGRKPGDWKDFEAEIASLNLPFLVTLASGIVLALGVGSLVIPPLMAAYPVQMRAFFFGLILASVWVPLHMISPAKGQGLAGIVGVAVIGAACGFVVTNPSNSFEITREWTDVHSRQESLEHLARRAPSAIPTDAIYWAPENDELRRAVAADNAALADQLHTERASRQVVEATNKKALETRAEPYNDIGVPAGVVVRVPRPAQWYVFAAGAVAISAMLLPGISGSYILLILGAYFFILNALKGFIKALAAGVVPTGQAGYVALFCAGAAMGLLSFARLLSYLLHKFPAYTLAGLVGMMVGCLRGIWPFRAVVKTDLVNTWPRQMTGGVLWALIMFVIGMVLVGTLTWISGHRPQSAEAVG